MAHRSALLMPATHIATMGTTAFHASAGALMPPDMSVSPPSVAYSRPAARLPHSSQLPVRRMRWGRAQATAPASRMHSAASQLP
jgi:hypothetical protein